MNRLLLLIALMAISVSAFSSDGFYPENKALSQLQKALKNKDLELGDCIDLSDELAEGRNLVAYRFTYPGEAKQWYAVFTESKGRYEMFDYLVVINPKGEIETVKVLKYRSEHGGEIASSKWLSQFEHYSGGDLYYEEEISAISGATISAMSITRDIPKVVRIIQSHSNE
ncbi:FMN-binding protein [Maribellus sediminis]|uniref:FMN-binding protein n=1 Tax=Maribellus sediminis TaxID=2696285 RepID=UPI0014318492|nr:FMN-binding protein [Maribellus sediminis]